MVKPKERHGVALFAIHRIRCNCGWFYEQPVGGGVKDWRLQDNLLDAYNTHIEGMRDRGRL